MTSTRRIPWWLGILGALVAFWLVAPVLIVVPLSFTGRDSFEFPPQTWSLDYYSQFFTDPAWRGPLITSLVLGVAVALLATLLGTLAAFAMVRGRFPGKSFLNGLILAPMITPGIIVAVAVFAVFLKWHLTGNFVGFLLAHTMIAVPLVVVTVSTSLNSFDTNLELAAASLGAPWGVRARRITLPLIMPGILSGALFAFVTSFDEVVIALFLQSPTYRTLPVKMYTSVTRDVDPTIAAASTVILLLTTTLILLATLTRRRRDAA
jgi:putative spermidine/putrescine transport system permease protein